MAKLGLNKAKCERLFGIDRGFWDLNNVCSMYLRFGKTLEVDKNGEVTNDWGEYCLNAHPHSEYLADLKEQRKHIAEKLEQILKSNILEQIDEAIEATTPLAIAETIRGLPEEWIKRGFTRENLISKRRY